jgi:hypothetical protein
VPIGHAVNPNICMVSSFSVHRDVAEARRRGLDGFRFFGYALGHHYGFGEHTPGRTDIWRAFEKAKEAAGPDAPGAGGEGGIGTPEQLRNHLRGFQESGVDQVSFIQQGGRNKHEHICEALELFAHEVMPEFKEKEAERVKKKAEELAPYVEKAMKRKTFMKPLADGEIPKVIALGRQVAERMRAQGQEPPPPQRAGAAQWAEAQRKVEKAEKAQ